MNSFLSAQGTYIFNRNGVALSGVGGYTFYSAFNSSRIRPYLSAVFAMVRASRNEVAFEDTAPAVPAKTAA